MAIDMTGLGDDKEWLQRHASGEGSLFLSAVEAKMGSWELLSRVRQDHLIPRDSGRGAARQRKALGMVVRPRYRCDGSLLPVPDRKKLCFLLP